ncbi:MAG: hypothetical protein IK095_00100, partial [Oscillospiraceae bacterium]|nr:hypothetical protein [Oscillospiraceae bacterium]
PPVSAETQLHYIALVNASVNGEEHMELAEEGHFLARAVLPDRASSVDYWTIDGKAADTGGRRYTLEFDSAGTGVVSAVLRERLNVVCDGCYLQFLDDNGTPGGPMYQKVYFEDKYIVPTTDAEHAGGSISCHIAAKAPKGMKVDYWVINGTVVRFDTDVTGFLLVGLSKSLDIRAVFTAGESTSLTDLIMQFDPVPDSTPEFPDDEPVILDNGDGDPIDWILDPDGTTGGPVEEDDEETLEETAAEHVHDWVYDAEHSYPASCPLPTGAPGQEGRNAFKCSICGATYYQTIPSAHQFRWVSTGYSTHSHTCALCGYTDESGWCDFVYADPGPGEDEGYFYCPKCGNRWYG